MDSNQNRGRPHVVVVGGGFGGMSAARQLRRLPVDVTLVDRRNHHLFQPLLYEVATAALSPGQIATPLRHVFRKQKNASVILGSAKAVDLAGKTLRVDDEDVPFDYLVLAMGATHHYFGNDQWEPRAPGLKTVEDALTIRARFLLAFEKAEQCQDPEERKRLMTVVIVGGGPTGLELAGTMSEVAQRVLHGEFRSLDTRSIDIVLVEAADRVLGAMPPKLSERAKEYLEKLGVTVILGTPVTEMDEDGVVLSDGRRIRAENVIWAAGVKGRAPAEGLDGLVRKDGRIPVEPDLSLPGHDSVFVVGDLAHVECNGKPVPGLAPAAVQMGKHVGARIVASVRGTQNGPASFRYRDKGSLATIGRGKAVAKVGRFEFGGVFAWLFWVFVHVLFLVGFRNRLMVLIDWSYAYVSFQRGARLITGRDHGR